VKYYKIKEEKDLDKKGLDIKYKKVRKRKNRYNGNY
jgi:hypothetical protein